MIPIKFFNKLLRIEGVALTVSAGSAIATVQWCNHP